MLCVSVDAFGCLCVGVDLSFPLRTPLRGMCCSLTVCICNITYVLIPALSDMQCQCLFKPVSVFQSGSVMLMLEHWSSIQFLPATHFSV